MTPIPPFNCLGDVSFEKDRTAPRERTAHKLLMHDLFICHLASLFEKEHSPLPRPVRFDSTPTYIFPFLEKIPILYRWKSPSGRPDIADSTAELSGTKYWRSSTWQSKEAKVKGTREREPMDGIEKREEKKYEMRDSGAMVTIVVAWGRSDLFLCVRGLLRLPRL